MKRHFLVLSGAILFVTLLINSAFADVAFITDSIYVTCVDKGNNTYEVFGHEVVLPKDFFKRVSKSEGYDKPDLANAPGGATADNICRVAAYYLQNNDVAQAKSYFEQAYKKDPTNFAAKNGYLRFHIEELVKKVIDEPDDFKKTFTKFKKSGDIIPKEYLVAIYLQLIHMFNDEKQKKRIVSKISSEIKSVRTKLQKLIKKDAEKNKVEILETLNLAKGMMYQPTKAEYLAINKYTEDYIQSIDILKKIAELFEITESFNECDVLLKSKLAEHLTSKDIGAILNKKINDDNVKIRETNAKFAAFTTMEREVLIHLNDYREILGLKRLLANTNLTKAASDHAYILNKIQELTHKSQNGSGPSDRAKFYGYEPELIAENLQKSADEKDTAETIILNWILSKEHNDNMINPDLEEVGIGNSVLYWVQLFGTPAKK